MSDTAWVIAWALGAAAALLLAAWLGRRWWMRKARAALVTLMARTDAVHSALRSMAELMGRMAEADEDTWLAFVKDSRSDERRAVVELCHRMEVLAHELAKTPLPKAAHNVADGLESIATDVRDATARIGASQTSQEVLDSLGSIDVVELFARLEAVEEELGGLVRAFRVKDPAVYGGGFHI